MKEYLSQFGILTPKEIKDLEKKVTLKELKKENFSSKKDKHLKKSVLSSLVFSGRFIILPLKKR